jgi:hypothetical protein
VTGVVFKIRKGASGLLGQPNVAILEAVDPPPVGVVVANAWNPDGMIRTETTTR